MKWKSTGHAKIVLKNSTLDTFQHWRRTYLNLTLLFLTKEPQTVFLTVLILG